MNGAKGPLLLIAGGCATMLGAAVVTVSLGSFFSDLPATPANAAAVSELPIKKVKTVSLPAAGKPTKAAVAAATTAVPAPQGPKATHTTARPKAAGATAPVVQSSDELHQTDPRWARTVAAAANQTDTARALESAFADDGEEQPKPGAAAATNELGGTGESFAMLSAPEDQPLEGDPQLAPNIDNLPTPAPRGAASAAKPEAPQGKVTGRGTIVNDAVNMRSAPRSGSGVLTVIPAGARVTLAPNCEQWCRVSYNGRSGYIYRSFVGGKRTAKTGAPRTQPSEGQTEAAGLFGKDGNFAEGAASTARPKPTTASQAATKPVIAPQPASTSR